MKIKIYYNKKCLALVAIIIQEILVLFLSYDSHHFQNSHHFYFTWGNGMSGLPWQLSGKKSACSSDCRRLRRHGFNPWVRKIPWRRKWQPTPVFLPGESYRQRSLVGCNPGGHKESDTTEHAHTYTYLHYLLIHFSMKKKSNSPSGLWVRPRGAPLVEIRWKDLWPQLSSIISLEDVKTLSK